jgi:hypothetical protein
MPKYELRNTADNSLSYVEGALPLNLTGLVAAGTYRAREISAEHPEDIVVNTFEVSSVDGDPVIDYGTGGSVSITVTGGVYAGTYTTNSDGTALTTTLIDAGPVNLKKPSISGTTDLGDTITVVPGFWIYDEPDPGDPTFQWQSDAVDIADEVGLTYEVAAPEQGTDLTVDETLGGVTVTSNTVSIPAPAMVDDVASDFWYDASTITVDGSNNITEWSNKVPSKTAWNLTATSSDASLPVWNPSSQRAEFNGSRVIRSTGDIDQFWTHVINNGGSYVIMAVVEFDSSAPGGVIIGASEGSGNNQSWMVGFDGAADFTVGARNNKFGNGLGINGFAGATTNSTAPGKLILEYETTQTEFNVRVNGVLEYTTTVNLGNMCDTTFQQPAMGAGPSTPTVSSSRMVGNIYEVFGTRTTSLAPFYRQELATRHGITL